MKKIFTLMNLMLFLLAASAQAPTTGATDPTADQADVISLFSGVYTDVPVTTWRTDWSGGKLSDTTIDGNAMKRYYDMGVAGIETTGANLIDASGMTHFNIDVWTAGAEVFKIKLVDFGADGIFSPANQGGDDTEHELVLSTKDNQGEWISYNIPLTYFTGLTSTAHMAQYILVAEPFGTSEIYVDNVYFSNNGPETMPDMAAAAPTADSMNVISMFSDAYTNVTVNTWRTPWSSATLEDIKIGDNNVKKYTGVNVIGIEAIGENLIDASDMEYFHVDIWSADFKAFKIKLVDWGADGGFDGGDDTEHELTFENPVQGEWISYKIPMSDFTGLTNRDKLAQFILVAETRGIPTVYVDNMYFSKEAPASTENVAAANINVYPVPAEGVLNVDLSKTAADIQSVKLMDLQGRVMNAMEVAQKTTLQLEVNGLGTGIYVLELKSAEGTFTKKVLIK